MASIINDLPSSISVRVGTNLVKASAAAILISVVGGVAINILQRKGYISAPARWAFDIKKGVEWTTFMMVAGTNPYVAVSVGVYMIFHQYAVSHLYNLAMHAVCTMDYS